MSSTFEANPSTVATTQSTTPWILAGGATAGSPGTAVLTAQGIAGGTPQPSAIQPGTTSVTVFTSIAATGSLVKTGAGIALSYQWTNSTATSSVPMLFDATTTRSNGAVPLFQGPNVPIGGQNAANAISAFGYGLPFSTGLWQQNSTTSNTMTAGASSAITGYFTYL